MKAAILAGMLLPAVAVGVSAAPVVLNPGFEAPVLADGANSGSPTFWVVVNPGFDVGLFNPTSSSYTLHNPLSAPAAGQNVGYIGNGGGSLCQAVGGVIQVGNTYTLTVAIGRRADVGTFPGYAIEIRATTSGNVKATSSSANPAAGTFVNAVASFTAVSDADTGSALTVCLTGVGQQTNFDEVSLTPVELTSFSVE